MFALMSQNTAAAESLLAHGADANAENQAGKTALIMAAIQGSAEAIRALIKWGAHVNHSQHDGRTALMFAASFGNREAVRVLLENGADTQIKDKTGHTAWDRAVRRKHGDIAAMLKQAASRKSAVTGHP